jgi:hypothetical protein
MPGVGEDDELAAGEHLHELARLRREQLVVVAVEQQDRRPGESFRLLASCRLGRQRHHADGVVTEDDAGAYRDGAAERVTHRDEAVCPATRRQLRHG